jgi:two-component system, NarL family, nitrate/nitrite response regulator NarL
MHTVVIYSKQPLMARGLASIIQDDFSVMGIFNSLDALNAFLLTTESDLIVIDNCSVEKEVFSRISSVAGRSAVIMWAEMISPEFVARCLSLGIRGVIAKSAAEQTYTKCFLEVVSGKLWIDASAQFQCPTTSLVRLTRRERQLVSLLVGGLRNKEIGFSLGIAEGTVKVYMSKLFQKVGVNDRFELALLALRNMPGSGDRFFREATSTATAAETFSFPDIIRIPASNTGAAQRPSAGIY